MATATYTPISTTTLSSSASSITFSSIPSTYTDLRVVLVGTSTSTANVAMYFNSDSGTNYSQRNLYGSGSTAASNSAQNRTYVQLTALDDFISTNPVMKTADIFSYAGSTYKTVLTTESDDMNGSGGVGVTVQLWRSTSAISTIAITNTTNNFATGTTATLYGIKAA